MKIVNFECNAPLDRNLIDSILNVCNALNANDRIYLHGNAISEISPRHPVQKLPLQLSGILSAVSRKGFAFRTLGRECAGGIFIAKTFPRKTRAQNHA